MEENPINNPFDEDEKAGRRPILWVMLGMAAACCGVVFAGALFYFQPDAKSLYAQYFPSPTFTPSRTPTSTPTLTPTATSTSTPTPNMTATVQVQNAQATSESILSNWNIIHTDTFDSNEYNWHIDTSDGDFSRTTYEIADGKYRWDTTAYKSSISWVRTGLTPLDGFYLSVDIQQVEGPETADYGILFREDDDSNFYYFAVSDTGYYALYLFYVEWKTLVEWTETDLIQQGEANRITVIGEGSHFTFLINDQYMMELDDDAIPEGMIALAVELTDPDDHAIFEFDNLDLRSP